MQYEARPIEPERTLLVMRELSLEDPSFVQFLEESGVSAPGPSEAWTLDDLTLAAFYFSPRLRLVRAQWETAQAARISAAQRPNPTLGLSPLYNSSSSIVSPWTITTALDFPIETAHKRDYRIAREESLADAARLDLSSAAWDVRRSVRDALIRLDVSTRRTQLLAELESEQAQRARLVETQRAMGSVSAVAVGREDIALAAAQRASMEARLEQDRNRLALAQAIGLPAQALKDLRYSLEGLDSLPAQLDLPETRRVALLQRADLLAELSRYAASEAWLHLQVAKQAPDFNLSPGYEFDQGDNKWGLGLSLELPVFHHNQGAIAQAEAQRAEQAARFNALQMSVMAEVEQSALGYTVALEGAARAEQLLERYRAQEEQLHQAYDLGQLTRLEVMQGRASRIDAQLAQLDADSKRLMALGQLEGALQSPLSLPAEENVTSNNRERARAQEAADEQPK